MIILFPQTHLQQVNSFMSGEERWWGPWSNNRSWKSSLLSTTVLFWLRFSTWESSQLSPFSGQRMGKVTAYCKSHQQWVSLPCLNNSTKLNNNSNTANIRGVLMSDLWCIVKVLKVTPNKRISSNSFISVNS